MKKIFALAIVFCIAFTLCACGVNTTFTSTESHTENGVTTTTTTTTTNGQTTTETTTQAEESSPLTCAEIAEDGEVHRIDFVISNDSEKTAIAELGFVPSGDPSRENFLQEKLEPGEALEAHINFDKDNLLWDFYLAPEGDDGLYEFTEINIANALVDNGFTLHFIEKDDGGWRVEG